MNGGIWTLNRTIWGGKGRKLLRRFVFAPELAGTFSNGGLANLKVTFREPSQHHPLNIGLRERLKIANVELNGDCGSHFIPVSCQRLSALVLLRLPLVERRACGLV